MAANNSIPAYGTLQASLSVMFANDNSSSVQINLIKLTNNSSAQRTLSIFLNADGVRTPILPENFKLNSGHMASDELTLMLRKDQWIEGFCDTELAVSYVIS